MCMHGHHRHHAEALPRKKKTNKKITTTITAAPLDEWSTAGTCNPLPPRRSSSILGPLPHTIDMAGAILLHHMTPWAMAAQRLCGALRKSTATYPAAAVAGATMATVNAAFAWSASRIICSTPAATASAGDASTTSPTTCAQCASAGSLRKSAYFKEGKQGQKVQ